jgi:uncharacterized protein YjiS (DUF1127 family)
MKPAPFTATAEQTAPVSSPKAPAGPVMPRKEHVARPMRWLLCLIHNTIVGRCRAAKQRRELAQLSDRRLRDAGIDLALAGRGKAAAVDRDALLRLHALSLG